MSRHHIAGFTLIELIIVMALSALLMLIAFSGQRELRDRTRFDTAINEMMQQIEYTRNYALAGINPAGQGNSHDATLAGAAFELDNDHTQGRLAELEPVYIKLDASGNPAGRDEAPNGAYCPNLADGECYEHYFTPRTTLRITNFSKAQAAYYNEPQGLRVCAWAGNSWLGYDPQCTAANPFYGLPVFWNLSDGYGHTARIRIDPVTGLPKRV